MDSDKNNQPTPIEQESFAQYRERQQNERMADRAPRRPWLILVGALFALMYLLVGLAMIFNWFKWTEAWALPRMIVGGVLIVYGFWRCWRVIQGTGPYSNR